MLIGPRPVRCPLGAIYAIDFASRRFVELNNSQPPCVSVVVRLIDVRFEKRLGLPGPRSIVVHSYKRSSGDAGKW
jgi:hypothetical protein